MTASLTALESKSLDAPDETRPFAKGHLAFPQCASLLWQVHGRHSGLRKHPDALFRSARQGGSSRTSLDGARARRHWLAEH